ncbi:MAG: hypothetical protein ACFFE2_13855 [Candidatus Thorarchaeota archaeon]
MEKAITGSIISTQLGNIGSKKYGFIGVKTDGQGELKIKVAAFTKYETLDIGKKVHIVAESIGDMTVMTAKSIAIAE